MTNRYKYMGFAAIAISVFFFFNPELSIIDLLPDFIGYLIVFLSIGRLADICPMIESARKRFLYASFSGIAKIFSFVFIFSSSNQSEQPVALLLFTFSFAVIDLIILIPAWKQLFNGIIYLSERTGASFPTKTEFGKVSTTGFAYFSTILFLFIKSLCAVLPETASLSLGGFDETTFNWYEYIGLLRSFGVVLALIFGVIWLIIVEKYWIRLCRDAEFIPLLKQKFDRENQTDSMKYRKRFIYFAFTFLAVAFFLCIDIVIEENNIIPDSLSAICFIAFFALLKGIYSKYKQGILTSAVYFVSALASDILQKYFHSNFFNTSVWTQSEANTVFKVKFAFVLISSIVFFVTVYFVCNALREIVSQYSGFVPKNITTPFEAEKFDSMKKQLNKYISGTIIMSAVSVFSACFGDFIVTMNSQIYDKLGSFAVLTHTLCDTWWIINALISLITFIVVIKCTSEIRIEVENRYLLD